MIGEREIEGYPALTLGSGDLEAAFVPTAGMVCCSLLHRGEEILGQRGGLRKYAVDHSTMGIPLLHPWANVVSKKRFSVAGREVDLDKASPPPHLDPHGQAIHGLLTGAPGWEVERHEATEDGGVLVARFDFGAERGLMAAFPFPHTVRVEAVVGGSTLTIATEVEATGDGAVPISFGWHPYLRLPGVPRAEWEIEIPVDERVELDELMRPTGLRDVAAIAAGAVGDRTFNDLYVLPPTRDPLVVRGGGRQIEVRMGHGYEYAQVYAPADDDVIALEPMTAPINAVVSGDGLRFVEPGETFEARFSVVISEFG